MPDELLAERFAAVARRRPDAVAVRDGDGALTYAELAARAGHVARAVSDHPRIGVLPRGDAASLAAVLGAMAAGTSVVLLDRHLSAAQSARVVDVARPALVVTSGRLPATLAALLDPAIVRDPAALAATGAARRAGREDELLAGLTSGTSGEPKLFVRDQASWATTLDRSDATFDVRPGDVVATPGPLDHSHFFYGALHALTRGATVDLRPLEDVAAGDAVTHLYLVPTLAVDLAAALGDRRLPGVREVVSSAAPWPEEARARLAERLPGATISHFYGASELSFVALSSSRDPAAGAYTPFPGVEVEVRDPGERRLPDGAQGVVHVRSDMLFRGYLAPGGGLTGGPDAGGWCTVGDLGTLHAGRLSLAGRASETIISGGFNVEPAQVEAALAPLPGVADVACVGLPDPRWGALPVAVIVLEPGATLSPGDVRAAARAALPQPSRPRRVYVTDALPRSPRGKLRRAELARQVLAGDVPALR